MGKMDRVTVLRRLLLNPRLAFCLTCFALGMGLTACTTVDFDHRLQSCRAAAYQIYPEKKVTVMRERTEAYEEFDGTTICDDSLSTGNTTRIKCRQGRITKYRRVPYVAVEDANADARNSHAWQCAQQACLRDFGNPDCEKPAATALSSAPAAMTVPSTNQVRNPPTSQVGMSESQAKQVLMMHMPQWMNAPQIRNIQGFGSLCGTNGWKLLGAWSDITDVTRHTDHLRIHVGSLWKAGIPCSVWEAHIPTQVSEQDFQAIKQAFQTLGAAIR